LPVGGGFESPYTAITSHTQLLSVHCVVITDGLLHCVDKKKEAWFPSWHINEQSTLGFIKTLTEITRQARYCGFTQSVPIITRQIGYDWLSRLICFYSCLSRRETQYFFNGIYDDK